MKRIDLMKATMLATGEWKLDPHSSLLEALNRKTFTTAPYTITMAEAHRPDLVAIKCYGKVDWWYILAAYNGIINPLAELGVGVRLLVPNFNEVSKLITKDKVKSAQGQKVEV